MKDFVHKATGFITFTLPVEIAGISAQFATVHSKYQEQFAHWTYSASRRKLIANFWFNQVLRHFAAVICLGMTLVFPFQSVHSGLLVPVVFTAFVTGISLTLFNYWPAFYADFLPKLDTIIAELEKLDLLSGERTKSKRTQFSIPALIIIFYCFAKTSGMNLPAANDRAAERLNQLFGADKDKLKQNLSRLYKTASLSKREKAELEKGVNMARGFFAAFEFSAAEEVLNHLDDKLQKAAG